MMQITPFFRTIHAPVVTGVPPANPHRDFMKMPDGELRHYGIVQRDTVHAEHIGIFLNTLHVADMFLQQVFELEGIIILRHFDR